MYFSVLVGISNPIWLEVVKKLKNGMTAASVRVFAHKQMKENLASVKDAPKENLNDISSSEYNLV